jgi:outer membrane protein assembly factor BamA
VGWQGQRTSLAANYSRTVTAGAGQQGALSSNTASSSASWQLARTWSVGSAASYALYKNVTPLSVSSSQGGHSFSGSVSLNHSLSEHFRAQLGYQRLHQTYNGIAAIAADPDADSAFISISYQLSRPLGR